MFKNYGYNYALFKIVTKPADCIDHDVVISGRKVRKKPFIEILVDVCMCTCKKNNYLI